MTATTTARRKPGRPPKSRPMAGTATDPTSTPAPAPADPEPKNPGGRPTNEAKLARVISGGYRALGKSLKVSMPLLSAALQDEAHELGSAVAAWAESSERVKKWAERAAGSMALVNVVTVHVSIIQILTMEIQAKRMGMDTSQIDYHQAKAMMSQLNDSEELRAAAEAMDANVSRETFPTSAA